MQFDNYGHTHVLTLVFKPNRYLMCELSIKPAVPDEFKETTRGRIPVVKTICLLLILLVINISACSKDDQEDPAGSFEKISLGVPSYDYPLFLHSSFWQENKDFLKNTDST